MAQPSLLYIHGFGSKVDPTSDKQIALRKIGTVNAYAPDYAQEYERVLEDVTFLLDDADLLIGTSMGGFLVSRLSQLTGKPFVAINPVLCPKATLNKYQGTHQDYYGRTFTVTETIASSYPGFSHSANGIVLLDMEDELIDSNATLNTLRSHMSVHTFEGGNHRFSHMEQALPIIQQMMP
jgi:predicted esterase YcpF (UPF0227 family)